MTILERLKLRGKTLLKVMPFWVIVFLSFAYFYREDLSNLIIYCVGGIIGAWLNEWSHERDDYTNRRSK